VEWFWTRASVGYTSLDLATFEADDQEIAANLVPSTLSGGVVGLEVAGRLYFVSLALASNVAFFSGRSQAERVRDYDLWSTDAELLFHLLSGHRVEPHILLGFGYSAFGDFGDAWPGGGDDDRIRGMNARVGFGVDYFFTNQISVGALVSGSVYFLTRPGVSAQKLLTPAKVETLQQARERVMEADGSSVGGGFALTIGPALHF
jgi:hypothetical protein